MMMIGGGGWRRWRRWSRNEPLRVPTVLVPVAHRVVRVQRGVQVGVAATHAAAKAAAAEGTFGAVQRLHHVAHHAP